jgi:hypothetical protein
MRLPPFGKPYPERTIIADRSAGGLYLTTA